MTPDDALCSCYAYMGTVLWLQLNHFRESELAAHVTELVVFLTEVDKCLQFGDFVIVTASI